MSLMDSIRKHPIEVLVCDFARAMKTVDSHRPTAQSARSGRSYQSGIGAFSEVETVKLVMQELKVTNPERYQKHCLQVKYPLPSKNKCDLCIGTPPLWDCGIEIKMLRLMGDNGRPNDNMLMHILSPYAEHRSALTDCQKLRGSGFGCKTAIMIFGYDYRERPIELCIEAFEKLSGLQGSRYSASVDGLIHPIHQRACVYGWELK